MAKSIKRNFLYNILLNISSVIFPLITAPYVSRVLEPDGVGLNNFASTYAGYFALVAVLGIPTYGVREVAKNKLDKSALTELVSQLMSIAVLTTLCVSIVYILTLLLIGQLSENFIIFLLAGFVMYLSPFKINWYYQGIEEFGFITFRSLVIKTLSIIAMFIFVREKDDLIIYIILGVLGGVAGDIWNYTKMYKAGIKPHFTLKGLKQHISPLFILFASSIAVSIYTVLDTIMLGFIADYKEVGFYSSAMHMSKVLLSAITSLSIVAVPRVSSYVKNKEYEKINDLMNKSFSVVSFLAFPAAIGMACLSPFFVPLFFGERFLGAVFPLMILSMLIIAIGLNNLTGVQVLIGMGLDKLFLYSVLTGTISNFVLNMVLIPLYGAVGASISSIFAETLILGVTSFYVYKYTPVKINQVKEISKVIFGSLLFIPLIVWLSSFLQGWILIFIFAISGCVCFLAIELFLKNKSAELFLSLIKNKLHFSK